MFTCWPRVPLARAGARCDRRALERDRPDVIVRERLEWVALVEGNWRVLTALLPQSEGVVEELPPHPHPLRRTSSREDVLAGVVEDAVADVPGVGPLHHCPTAVGVVRRGAAQVERSDRTPSAVAFVVARSVERADLERQIPTVVAPRSGWRRTGHSVSPSWSSCWFAPTPKWSAIRARAPRARMSRTRAASSCSFALPRVWQWSCRTSCCSPHWGWSGRA